MRQRGAMGNRAARMYAQRFHGMREGKGFVRVAGTRVLMDPDAPGRLWHKRGLAKARALNMEDFGYAKTEEGPVVIGYGPFAVVDFPDRKSAQQFAAWVREKGIVEDGTDAANPDPRTAGRKGNASVHDQFISAVKELAGNETFWHATLEAVAKSLPADMNEKDVQVRAAAYWANWLRKYGPGNDTWHVWPKAAAMEGNDDLLDVKVRGSHKDERRIRSMLGRDPEIHSGFAGRGAFCAKVSQAEFDALKKAGFAVSLDKRFNKE
jgi:hypothetical protein